jgi:hypothetical protein
VKIGSISFMGEGSETWLAAQLKVILAEAPKIAVVTPEPPADSGQATPSKKNEGGFTTALGTYLTEKNAATNQVKRFLATADWLRRRGTSTLTTAAVTQALKDNHQPRLSNPADCLNQNVGKGHAEKKAGKEFFITPAGLTSLGHAA